MTTEERGPKGAQGGSLLGPRLVAVALLALAALLIVSALGITRGGGYTVIGPATIPLVVAIGLLVLGAIFAAAHDGPARHRACRAGRRGGARAPIGRRSASPPWRWSGTRSRSTASSSGPLEVPGLGYIVATGIFLPLTARILGSRSLIRDVIVGFGIGIVVYFGFTEFLGVRLPAGILGPLL